MLISGLNEIHLSNDIICSLSKNASLLVGKEKAHDSADERDNDNGPSNVKLSLLSWELKRTNEDSYESG